MVLVDVSGVSVAFGAPLGGLLLAIEEGSSFLSSGIFWRGFLATCTGVLTLQLLAQCHSAGSALAQTKFGVWRDLGCAGCHLPRGPPAMSLSPKWELGSCLVGQKVVHRRRAVLGLLAANHSYKWAGVVCAVTQCCHLRC